MNRYIGYYQYYGAEYLGPYLPPFTTTPTLHFLCQMSPRTSTLMSMMSVMFVMSVMSMMFKALEALKVLKVSAQCWTGRIQLI